MAASPYPPASDTTLKEEQSKGYDFGLSWLGASGLYLEAVYFDQKVEDEIYFDLTDFSGYLQRNGDTDSSGVELVADWPLLATLSISANYTFNDTETSSGDSRPYRPQHLANLGLNWRSLAGKLVLGASWRLSQDAQDIDGTQLDDYQVLELTASYQLFEGLQLYGRLENALDEDYEEVPTYNTSGAAGYAGLRYSFLGSSPWTRPVKTQSTRPPCRSRRPMWTPLSRQRIRSAGSRSCSPVTARASRALHSAW